VRYPLELGSRAAFVIVVSFVVKNAIRNAPPKPKNIMCVIDITRRRWAAGSFAIRLASRAG